MNREDIPFNWEMDQSLRNRQQNGAPENAVPVGTSRQGSVPAQERGIISGDNVQFRRLRQRTRLSQSESQSSGPEEEQLSSSVDARVSRRTPNHQQVHGQPITKSSGTPHHQNKKSRNRTSSETEQGVKGGSRGPTQRKRVHSETENRSRWEKYDTCHTRNGREMCVTSLNYCNDYFVCLLTNVLCAVCRCMETFWFVLHSDRIARECTVNRPIHWWIGLQQKSWTSFIFATIQSNIIQHDVAVTSQLTALSQLI